MGHSHREVAAGLKKIKDTHGGDKIYFIGGGGQGNHLGALYSNGLMKALGIKYMTNALAQEKTGEFWVQGKCLAAEDRTVIFTILKWPCSSAKTHGRHMDFRKPERY